MLLGTENGWPLLFAITAVPAIFQLVVLPLCPESPNHLLIREGNELAAQRGWIDYLFIFFYRGAQAKFSGVTGILIYAINISHTNRDVP